MSVVLQNEMLLGGDGAEEVALTTPATATFSLNTAYANKKMKVREGWGN